MNQFSLQNFSWLFEPKQWKIRHALFWFYRFFEVIMGKLGILDDIFYPFPDIIFLGIIPDFLFVYCLLWWVIPNFLLKNKISLYLIISFFVIIAYSLFTFLAGDYFGWNDEEVSPMTIFVSFDFMDGIQVWLLVTGLRLFFEYLNAQVRVSALQQSNYESELAFLKSQISPHFLFNTLNNVATLTEHRPEEATETIVNLSNVLRYQLYESEKEKVLLKNEIANLKNYINLEKIRLAGANIVFEVEGDVGSKTVSPLLFIPFLENAMKHGVLADGTIELAIQFKVFNNGLEFLMTNQIADVKPEHQDGGIGLKNLRRRLEILYPNRHNLRIQEHPNLYEVQLNLVFE